MRAGLADITGLPVARNMETASRAETAQSTAWAHLGRDRGCVEIIKDELVNISRERLRRRAAEHRSDDLDRTQPNKAYPQSQAHPFHYEDWNLSSANSIGRSQRAR